MSDLSPPPLPSDLYIPPELLREIFPYCDTPTLGNVCTSSRTFLEIASPFLYTHIVLKDTRSVVKLFHFDLGVEGDLLVAQILPSWNRLSSFVLSNAWCDLVWFHHPLFKARARRERGSPSSFAVYLDGLDPPLWDLTTKQPILEWANVVYQAQRDLDMGAAQAIEVVVWVETEEMRREVKKLTTEAEEEVFSWAEHSARFDVRVEVWPPRAGRRDRVDAWARKTIESWR